MGEGAVQQTVRELAADLHEAGIDYAIIGAMALNAHGFARETVDVDVLVTKAGLERFRERLVGRGYVAAFPEARKMYRNARTGTKVEFITSGEYPGDGKPKPDPAGVGETVSGARFVDLPTLINLKLASGMSHPGRRRDLADIQDLIRILGLTAKYAEVLDPYVRPTFLTLLSELSLEDPHPERDTP